MMRGVILAIASDGTYGQISADDGRRYSYWTSEIRNGHGRVGDEVDFQMYGDQPVDIYLLADQEMAAPAPRPNGRPAVRPRVVGPQQVSAQGSPVRGISVTDFISSLPPVDYWIRLFTSPSGRISRREFWLYGVLPLVLASILLGWIPLVNIAVMLACFWGSVCIGFKRFHDVGYPGWWCLINIVPAFAASLLASLSLFVGVGLLGIAGILSFLSLAILVAQILMVYIRVGQPGDNRYGPDPLA